MDNNLVVQSNDLVQATYTMTTTEKELLLTCISRIDSRPEAPSITKQTKFTVTLQEIIDIFYRESNKKNAFRDVEIACNNLFEREVIIALDDGELRTRFISGVKLSKTEENVTLTFAEDILPYLTQLKANFTKYKLLEISELSSIHAIRLYELIICWLGQFRYSKEFSLDDFRYIMGLKGKYKQFSELRKNVVDVAVKQINENTNYKVSVVYQKKAVGKGFKGLTLKFHKKILDKIAGKNGLTEEKIKAIVDNVQFMKDYNDHPSLTYQGKTDTDTFKREMMHIIQREPETFNKKNKELESYLAPVKQGK